jgi:hypothetical protein
MIPAAKCLSFWRFDSACFAAPQQVTVTCCSAGRLTRRTATGTCHLLQRSMTIAG